MPCDFPGCGRIFSNRQYLNVSDTSRGLRDHWGCGWGGEKDTPGLRCRYNLVVVQLSSMCKVAHTAFGVEGKAHAPQLVRASGPKYREGQRW